MKLFTLFLLIIVNYQIYAQQSVIPPSPEASSLAKYANTPVNLFSGIPQISVPLSEIKMGGYSLPIQLNYFANGIQVEQIASNVGLGWSLNAGGVIARSVVGFPDDISAYIGSNNNTGYLINDNATQVLNYDPNETDPSYFFGYYIDTEPDVYFFNIGGKVGKFVIDKDKNVCFLTHTNWKSQCFFNTDGSIDYFTITDDNGIKYEFKEKEITKTTVTNKYINFMYHREEYINSSSFSFVSGWYLSKIIPANGEEITLVYSSSTINYNLRVQEVANYCNDDNCVGTPPDIISLKQEIQTKNISTLTSNSQFIEFGYSSTDREDLPGAKSLSTITIYSQPGKVVTREYKFGYSYFLSKGVDAASATDKPLYKRLKLESIQEGNGKGSYLPATTFNYNYVESGNNELRLPNRLSCEQDIWGYYNANGATTLIPKTYVYPNDYYYLRAIPDNFETQTENYTLPGANRIPDQSGKYTSANILTQINYPTGGYTKYIYEPNDYVLEDVFSVSGGGVYKGCGLRISKIEMYDGVNHTDDNIKEYFYTDSKRYGTSSGAIFYIPSFAFVSFITEDGNILNYDETNEIYYHKDASGNYDLRLDFFKNVVKRYSINIASFGATSNLIGYREVKVKETGKGYTIYRFNVPGSFREWDDAFGNSCNYANTCDGLYFNTKINSQTYEQMNCSDEPEFTYEPFWNYKAYNDYPFPPHPSYDWNRGLLTSKSVYNESGTLVESEDNYYDIFVENNDNINSKKVYGIKIGGFYHPKKNRNDIGCYKLLPPLRYAKYEIFTRCARLLHSTTLTRYDLNDNTKSVSITKDFSYNKHGQLSSISETQSDGSTLKSEIKYPSDYNPNTSIFCPKADDRMTNALCKMIEKNILDLPIETITIKDNTKILGANLNLYRYDYSKGIVVLNQQLEMDLKSPLLLSSFAKSYIEEQTISLGITSYQCDKLFHFDNRYTVKKFFDSYDSYGNLLQSHQVNMPNICYIWAYNKTYPIAEVLNATHDEDIQNDEVYFTSYEEDADIGNIAQKCTTIYHNGIQSMVLPAQSFNYAHDFKKSALNGKYKYSAWIRTNNTGVGVVIKDFTPNVTNPSYIITYVPNTNGQWQYFEVIADMSTGTFPAATTVRAEVLNGGTGTAYVDDVRFLPVDAKMTTYTYSPLIGMTSSTDNNGFTTYYEYDSFGRLYRVKDFKGNVLKQYEYHYQGQ